MAKLNLSDDELRYLSDVLVLKQPSGAAGLIDALDRGGNHIQICPDCLREIYATEKASAVGHEKFCRRALRYAIIAKLETLEGG